MPDPSKAKNIIIPVDHYPIGRLKIIVDIEAIIAAANAGLQKKPKEITK